jgi:hypothetical protein
MYSQHLLRVHHDEWLRHAETRRLVNEAKAHARQPGSERSRLRTRPQRALFGLIGLHRPVSHA